MELLKLRRFFFGSVYNYQVRNVRYSILSRFVILPHFCAMFLRADDFQSAPVKVLIAAI